MQNLHAATGAIDGALLGDGMELRLPLPAASRVASLLQPGNRIAAQGYALDTPYGRVMAVQAIGATPDRLIAVAAAPPPPPVARIPAAPSAPPAP